MPLSPHRGDAHHGQVAANGYLRVVIHDRTNDRRTAERRQRRQARWSAQQQPDRPGAGPTGLLLVDSRRRGSLTLRHNRVWTRLTARLVAPSLDRRLAEGRPPESNRLLAARADVLVSPVTRCGLAQDWSRLMGHAQAPRSRRDLRVPVNRNGLVACRGAVEEMVGALSARAPLGARGVAMASWLLRDGSGPLYDRRRSAELGVALSDVIGQLAPSIPG